MASFVVSQKLRSAHSWRLFIWLIPRFKTADRLKGETLEAFTAWHEAHASQFDPKSITTVQFTHRQAAEIYNNSRTMSGRYIAELVDAGILNPIAKGSRSMATLYLVCPTCTHSWKCANESADLHTNDPVFAHKTEVICTHAEPVSCNDKTYPINNPINNPSGATASAPKEAAMQPPTCPECDKPTKRTSSTRNEHRERLYLCHACGKEVWVKQ